MKEKTLNFHKIAALTVLRWPEKPVSPTLQVLPFMEGTSPADDFGNVNKRCGVYWRSSIEEIETPWVLLATRQRSL